jgi:hypothetical protein
VSTGMAVISGTSVWIVGNASLHWNGRHLSPATGPGGWFNEEVNGLATLKGGIWALGGGQPEEVNGHTPSAYSYVDHWNGRKWISDDSPAEGVLVAGVAISPNDVWAVGGHDFELSSTLTEHWDGSSWQEVQSPSHSDDINGIDDAYYGVDGVASNDVWAVGDLINQNNGGSNGMIAHWNGISWHEVSSPQPGSWRHLASVTAVSGKSAWAVGSYSVKKQRQQALIERFRGCVS